MKVIAFIEPPQGEIIEKILRHCGLWNPSAPRPPPGDCPDFCISKNGTVPFADPKTWNNIPPGATLAARGILTD